MKVLIALFVLGNFGATSYDWVEIETRGWQNHRQYQSFGLLQLFQA